MKEDKNRKGNKDYVNLDGGKNTGHEKSEDERLLEERWEKFIKESGKPPQRQNKTPEDGLEVPVKKIKGKPSDSGSITVKKSADKTIKTDDRNDKAVKTDSAEVTEMSESQKPKSDEEQNEILETDVDKLYEIAKEKGIIKIKEASKLLGIESNQVEEWGRILEEHKLVRLRYPPVGEPVIILKKFTMEREAASKAVAAKKLKPRRRVFIINIAVLAVAAVLISFYTVRIPTIKITYSQAYLAVILIIIIGIVLIFRFLRGRKNARKGGQKTDKKS